MVNTIQRSRLVSRRRTVIDVDQLVYADAGGLSALFAHFSRCFRQPVARDSPISLRQFASGHSRYWSRSQTNRRADHWRARVEIRNEWSAIFFVSVARFSSRQAETTMRSTCMHMPMSARAVEALHRLADSPFSCLGCPRSITAEKLLGDLNCGISAATRALAPSESGRLRFSTMRNWSP